MVLEELQGNGSNPIYSTVQQKLYIEYRARFAFERESFERVSSTTVSTFLSTSIFLVLHVHNGDSYHKDKYQYSIA